jgi:hypothetical protein
MGGLHWFWVGLVILIAVLIPLLRPLGLPITIQPWTRSAYETMINSPKDKVVVIEDLWGVGSLAEAESAHTALIRILLKNDIPFVLYSQGQDSPALHLYILDKVQNYPEARGKVYGEDYVLFGYLPGGEGAIPVLAEDFHQTFKTDYFGTPIEQLPLMDNLHNYEDVSFVITIAGQQTWIDVPVRQWYNRYNVPLISYTQTGGTVVSIQYYPNSGVLGIIEGSRGGAELEYLGAVFGIGQAQSDAKTLSFLTIFGFVILGNISYFASRRKTNG